MARTNLFLYLEPSYSEALQRRISLTKNQTYSVQPQIIRLVGDEFVVGTQVAKERFPEIVDVFEFDNGAFGLVGNPRFTLHFVFELTLRPT